jgi:ABC-type dipeptide/oligopeptide/nickel transport system permease component
VIRFTLRRLLLLVPVLVGITLVTFALARVVPRNVAYVWAGAQGFRATPEAAAQLTRQYHLDAPLPVQYLHYMADLLRGDLGTSPVTTRPVISEIKQFLPNTIELALSALLLSVLLGLPIGVISAVRRNTLVDHLSRLTALLGVSMPVFWLGLLLQLIFYSWLGLVPDPGGRLSNRVRYTSPVQNVTGFLLMDTIVTGNWVAFGDALGHLILPTIALALPQVAMISRMTRSSMLEVLEQDYIRTSRAKGLSERVVSYRHALRNALLPVTTVVGLSLAWLLTGSVVTEVVFYWPGLGRYGVEAILAFDFPGVMAFTIIAACVFVFANLATDLLYVRLDPRLRERGVSA